MAMSQPAVRQPARLVSALLALGALATPCARAAEGQAPGADRPAPVYPGAAWEARTPEEAGLSRARLDALRDLVGGRGCVVRHGYLVYSWGDVARSADIASAVKPVISTLLLLAVQEGKLRGGG
jgi:CubicO group peptidase (beta-lactamase class C family)